MRMILIITGLFLACDFTTAQQAGGSGTLKSSYEIFSGGTTRQLVLVADEICLLDTSRCV